MELKAITLILNVKNIGESFEWFVNLGWSKNFEWGEPVGFGAVGSGQCQIFLCQDGQGSRGKGANKNTFGPNPDEVSDKGVWMSWWVDDVDSIHQRCLELEYDITFDPCDMPWGVREMHLRHPDGHVFRITASIAA